MKKNDGWGADWCVSWQDGPTEQAFNEATDLDLFATYHDTFDGMTDYADTEAEEFTDFAVKYMGKHSNTVKTERETSEERKAEALAHVIDAAPELDKKGRARILRARERHRRTGDEITKGVRVEPLRAFRRLWLDECKQHRADYMRKHGLHAAGEKASDTRTTSGEGRRAPTC